MPTEEEIATEIWPLVRSMATAIVLKSLRDHARG